VRRVSVLLLTTILVFPAFQERATAGTAEASARAEVFPNLDLITLDGSGTVDLESFRGRPVLISIWASWCGPCRIELPELQQLYTELAGEGFVLLTINVDTSSRQALRFLDQIGIKVPVYRLFSNQLRELGVNGLPTNILLDQEGRAVRIYEGYSPVLSQEIRRLVLEMVGAETAGDATSDK
jgi:thiol-disulfide isomerase/thioredoxin